MQSRSSKAQLTLSGNVDGVSHHLCFCGSSIRGALAALSNTLLDNSFLIYADDGRELTTADAHVKSASIGGWRVM